MITPALLLTTAALASDPASYPLTAELDLPQATMLRLDLDAAWLAQCPDPGSYLLLDASGAEVPFAARSSDEGADWRHEALSWEPVRVDRGWAWRVNRPASGEPAQALRLAKLPPGSVVELTIQPIGAGGTPQQAVLWNLPGSGAGTRLELPLSGGASAGPWTVRATWAEGAGWMRVGRDLGFEAVIAQPWTVEPATVTVPLEGPLSSSATSSDWLLRLPRAGLPVRGLGLSVDDPLFARGLTVLQAEGPERLEVVARQDIERLNYGEAWVDNSRVALRTDAPAELVLRSDDGRSAPLRIRAAELTLRGQALIVPEVPGGHYTLLGCGPPAPGYDLERLEDRLAEIEPISVQAPGPGPHPGWVPASAGEGLLEAGPELAQDGLRWRRTVTGPPGLVRLPLDDHILAATRPGNPDLRFVDDQGRQLPYLLRQDPLGQARRALEQQREEQGARSVITLPMDPSGLPALRLVLHSERTRFQRSVQVFDGPADSGVLLARAGWTGAEEGESRLVLELSARLGAQLTVVVDNGDNPPLPIDEVELITRSASAWLALPATGGVAAVYGHDELPAPRYDLQLLREQVLTQPVQPASLGAPEVLEPPPPEPPRKGLLLVAVAVLTALLLALIVRLVKTPEEPSLS
jgi:hypothetical protein